MKFPLLEQHLTRVIQFYSRINRIPHPPPPTTDISTTPTTWQYTTPFSIITNTRELMEQGKGKHIEGRENNGSLYMFTFLRSRRPLQINLSVPPYVLK